MAGLYGDLPDAIKTGSEATKWGAMPNLQPQARPKQEAPKPKPAAPVLAPPPALLRAGRGGGRTPGAGGRGGGRVISSSIAADGADAGQGAAAAGTGPVQQSSISIFASVKDEYDPLKPNDYEEVRGTPSAACVCFGTRHDRLILHRYMQLLHDRGARQPCIMSTPCWLPQIVFCSTG